MHELEMMKSYTLIFPDNYDDFDSVYESKGWLSGVVIKINGRMIHPIFYDSTRLSQDIAEEVSSNGHFMEPNVIVLDRVTRKLIEAAVDRLATSGDIESMISQTEND